MAESNHSVIKLFKLTNCGKMGHIKLNCSLLSSEEQKKSRFHHHKKEESIKLM